MTYPAYAPAAGVRRGAGQPS